MSRWFRRRNRMTEDDDLWQPEGGEIVANSMLVEIDEIVGSPALAGVGGLLRVTQGGEEPGAEAPDKIDLVAEHQVDVEEGKLAKAREVEAFLYELSGKIAVTGALDPDDGERLVALLGERGPIDVYRNMDIDIDLSMLP